MNFIELEKCTSAMSELKKFFKNMKKFKGRFQVLKNPFWLGEEKLKVADFFLDRPNAYLQCLKFIYSIDISELMEHQLKKIGCAMPIHLRKFGIFHVIYYNAKKYVHYTLKKNIL